MCELQGYELERFSDLERQEYIENEGTVKNVQITGVYKLERLQIRES